MNEGSEERLAGTGFPNNDKRGKAVSKGRDPLLELDNGGAAAYDLQRVQGSGRDERRTRIDQRGGFKKRRFLYRMVSGLRGSLDSKGLCQNADCGMENAD